MNGAGKALRLYPGNGSVSGECENRRMQNVGTHTHTGRDGARPSSSVATGGHGDWRDDLRVVRVR